MRYTKAKCKICRREGEKLFLKGDRCHTAKCPIDRKGALPPGQHGQKGRRGKLSSYGQQLREKQKTKRMYGLTERQFKRYYQKASRERSNTGLKLLQYLETRLDNVLAKTSLVPSRSVARQFITHGFVLVDNQKINIPSYQLKPGETVTLNSKGLKLDHVKNSLKEKATIPAWLKKKAAVVKIERLPERKEIESSINEQLIVEFYSR